MSKTRTPKILPIPLEEVIAQVTELYERDPLAFAKGMETGRRQSDYAAGRDYLGLVLGNVVIYRDDRTPEATRRAFNLNDSSFALGAVIGIIEQIPRGKFANVCD